jgi:hypothetical protein
LFAVLAVGVAGSQITEIDASHAVPATHPADVAAGIAGAVKAIR